MLWWEVNKVKTAAAILGILGGLIFGFDALVSVFLPVAAQALLLIVAAAAIVGGILTGKNPTVAWGLLMGAFILYPLQAVLGGAAGPMGVLGMIFIFVAALLTARASWRKTPPASKPQL